MKKLTLLLFATMLACCSCEEKNPTPGPDVPDTPDVPTPTEETGDATIWTTTFDKSRDFAKSTVKFGKKNSMSPYVVNFTDDTYQTIDGFGLAVTQASCYNLLKMSAEDRTRILKELFSPTEGAGSSLIRVCIGGSDFSMDEFTWCDSAGMEHFGIHRLDVEYLFPILDEIYSINPDVQIIGSPWSSPRWMKMDVDGKGNSYNKWTSGRLNPKYYSDYGTYFVKWVQAMEQRGYKVLAVTLQNEPLNHGNSMSLYMPWEDQRDFLKVIGPAFKAAGLKTQILLFDHNYNYDGQGSQMNYPLNIFADAEASQYTSGSAWHNYGGSVTELDKIHSAAPDKGIWFTEASIGTWNYDGHGFGGQLREDMSQIVFGTLTRYGKGITLWNMMLDDERKPYRPGGCSTCYGALQISHDNYSYASTQRLSHWYDVAHPSVCIRPGAVRIGTSGYTVAKLSYLAFRNPDGSYGILALNEGSEERQLVFVSDAHSVHVNIPANSVVSALWKD
ncbi:MAG: glucosylceramidase [Bacteroidales bacterium]|nr:glucosylceramidase [Bacteroidales bacterium]